MKTIPTILGALFVALAVCAQDSNSPAPIAVKSPVILKGMYGNRTQDRPHKRNTDDAVVGALRFFKTTQNPDGSWGRNEERNLATPLILLSFLGRGETAHSHEFGSTVSSARNWLLDATPSNTASRLVTVVALSAYCDMVYGGNQPELKSNEVANISSLLSHVSPQDGDTWLDFAAFYTMPADLTKPTWMRRTRETHLKYLDVAAVLEPRTVEEYLRHHLVALASFHKGGNTWVEFNRSSTPKLMAWQKPDGSYPVDDGQSRFAAAALATLRLEIYYQYEPRFWAQPEPKAAETQAQEIKIDVK